MVRARTKSSAHTEPYNARRKRNRARSACRYAFVFMFYWTHSSHTRPQVYSWPQVHSLCIRGRRSHRWHMGLLNLSHCTFSAAASPPRGRSLRLHRHPHRRPTAQCSRSAPRPRMCLLAPQAAASTNVSSALCCVSCAMLCCRGSVVMHAADAGGVLCRIAGGGRQRSGGSSSHKSSTSSTRAEGFRSQGGDEGEDIDLPPQELRFALRGSIPP